MLRAFFLSCLVLLCSSLLQAQEAYTEHKVRWMENIHTIARKYKVDVNLLLDYNQISAEDVKRGRILRIPTAPSPEKKKSDEDLFADPPDEITPGPFNPDDCANYQPYVGITHRVSLILPLKLYEIPANSYFMDFYQGVLLAAQDMKEQGMGLRLQVFDIESTPVSILAHSPELRQEELIIGPAYAKNLLPFIQDHGNQTLIVSPLDPQTEAAVEGNPRFFQVSPSPASLQRNLLQYVHASEGKVWLMYDADVPLADAEWLRITRECLEQMGIPYSEFTHRVNVNIVNTLRALFAPYTHNQVIVSSGNKAFVSDLLRNLHSVHNAKDSPISLFGDARWRNFEDIDLDYFHNMNLRLSLPHYVDYQREDLRHFLARYRGLYHTDPSLSAFQGYDVALYFLRALYTKGPSFEYCLSETEKYAQPLQSPLHFQRLKEGSGFVNTQARVIQYLPDYSIKVLGQPSTEQSMLSTERSILYR